MYATLKTSHPEDMTYNSSISTVINETRVPRVGISNDTL